MTSVLRRLRLSWQVYQHLSRGGNIILGPKLPCDSPSDCGCDGVGGKVTMVGYAFFKEQTGLFFKPAKEHNV